MRRALGLVATVSCLVLAAPAGGDPVEEPIDLAYRAYEGCPTEKQFLDLVVGRAARALVASERSRARKFVVTLIPRRRETLGKLEIAAGGASGSREVSGSNCAEVASALALFTALAIDPSASLEPPPAPPADSPAPTPPIAPPLPPVARTEQPPPRIQRARPWGEFLAGVRAAGAGGFDGGSATPVASRGGGLFAQWTSPGFGALRLGGDYFLKNETGDATFAFLRSRVDGCPLVLRPTRRLAFEPCIAVELGRVEASSHATATLSPSTERRWWASGDVLGRLRYAPVPWIFVEIEGGVAFPFTRYVFFLGTETERREVHRVPLGGWVLGLGLGGRIL